jgi:hypothetical protein
MIQSESIQQLQEDLLNATTEKEVLDIAQAIRES